jgi:hypothetical protein
MIGDKYSILDDVNKATKIGVVDSLEQVIEYVKHEHYVLCEY